MLGALGPAQAPPRTRIGSGRGGACAFATQGPFPIGGCGGASPEADGGERRWRLRRLRPAGVAAASSTLRSLGVGPGSHASHAPGPAGRLPAGLGGAAAGLPEHSGERQCGRPLVPSPVSLAQGQGSGSLVSGPRELGVRGRGPWCLSRGTLLSASLECPTEAPFARAAATTPAGPHCARRT